jgi:hypothetical protein
MGFQLHRRSNERVGKLTFPSFLLFRPPMSASPSKSFLSQITTPPTLASPFSTRCRTFTTPTVPTERSSLRLVRWGAFLLLFLHSLIDHVAHCCPLNRTGWVATIDERLAWLAQCTSEETAAAMRAFSSAPFCTTCTILTAAALLCNSLAHWLLMVQRMFLSFLLHPRLLTFSPSATSF